MGDVLTMRGWSEIQADLTENWWVYLSLPLVAMLIGYVTKVVVVEMIYRPMEFRGVGILGWQGLVPRRAGKVAAITITMLTENLLKPEEILARIDARDAFEQLREPLTRTIDDLAHTFAEELWPGMWDSLPSRAREAAVRRIREQAPEMAEHLLLEMRDDLHQILDLEFLTVSTMVRNKRSLNRLMRRTAGSTLGFIRKSGVFFGLAIGLVQVVAWATLHSLWIMPVFGFITGFLSDWAVLNLLFHPRYPRRFLGFRIQGVLHTKREEITRDYARLMATDLLDPTRLMTGILTGPGSDRLFAMIHREVSVSIDHNLGVARPLLQLTIGTRKYQHLKDAVVQRLLEDLPETMHEAEQYAVATLDIENTLVAKMRLLTNEQFEAIMRPIFKDDEWLMVSVGAILGAIVGELQVHLITYFGAR